LKPFKSRDLTWLPIEVKRATIPWWPTTATYQWSGSTEHVVVLPNWLAFSPVYLILIYTCRPRRHFRADLF
jgi:hypothetical protein